jgi:hypothetical protein
LGPRHGLLAASGKRSGMQPNTSNAAEFGKATVKWIGGP